MNFVDAAEAAADDNPQNGFVIHKEARLIWDALDSHGNFEDLLVVLAHSREEGGPEARRDSLRKILDDMMKVGLVEFSLSSPVQKNSQVVVEDAAGEMLVLMRDRPKVLVFNDSSAVLWEALDEFSTLDALTDLALEAWQSEDPEMTRRQVMIFFATLYDAGLINPRGGGSKPS